MYGYDTFSSYMRLLPMIISMKGPIVTRYLSLLSARLEWVLWWFVVWRDRFISVTFLWLQDYLMMCLSKVVLTRRYHFALNLVGFTFLAPLSLIFGDDMRLTSEIVWLLLWPPMRWQNDMLNKDDDFFWRLLNWVNIDGINTPQLNKLPCRAA